MKKIKKERDTINQSVLFNRLCKVFYKVKEKLAQFGPIVPSFIVAVGIGIMLMQYKTPDYKAQAVETIVLPTASSSPEIQKVKEGSFDLGDGLYQGTGNGYGGSITVAVEVKEKRIENIWVLSAEEEDTAFFNQAKELLNVIIEQQNPAVDVVSGATYSSKGLLEAVANALSGNQSISKVTAPKTILEEEEYSDLADGAYTGSSTGFGGKIKAQVTIKEGKITDIKILEAAGEGATYLAKASGLIRSMKAAQNTNVDVVSGATYTSNGLIKAVRNALAKAEGAQEEEETQATKEGSMPYLDGVYYGRGTGFAGDITVAVAITNKTLKAAIVTKSSDDDPFLTNAKSILDKVVLKQTVKVDAVSGATFSSKGILEALKNAMKEAKKVTKNEGATEVSTEEDSTQDDTSTETETSDQKLYNDGNYAVTINCSPDTDDAFEAYALSMNVFIKGDLITAVSDVKGGGATYDSINDSFIIRAANGTSNLQGVVPQIIKKGNLSEIDVVSGATCTSKAIIEGCKSALNLAKINPVTTSPEPSTTPNTPVPTTTPTPTKIPEDTTTPTITYKDGTYTASEVCFPDDKGEFEAYDTQVKVTISGNKITGITDIIGSGSSYITSNAPFIKLAANGSSKKIGVISQIIAKGNTTEIDTVSGATCSSRAIIEACRLALEAAKQ